MNRLSIMNQSTRTKKSRHGKSKAIKLGLLTSVSLGILSLVSLPSVRALPLPISDFLPSASINLPTINVPNFNTLWQGTLSELTQTLEDIPGLNELGALGLPDIFEIAKEIEKKAGHKSWDEVHESQRLYAELIAKANLSKEGQDEVKQNAETIEQQVVETEAYAQAANQEVITQNVLKQMAFQQTKQAVIMQLTQQELSDLNFKQDVNNMVLSNVSKTLDKGERSQEEERAAQARSQQEILGYMRLY